MHYFIFISQWPDNIQYVCCWYMRKCVIRGEYFCNALHMVVFHNNPPQCFLEAVISYCPCLCFQDSLQHFEYEDTELLRFGAANCVKRFPELRCHQLQLQRYAAWMDNRASVFSLDVILFFFFSFLHWDGLRLELLEQTLKWLGRFISLCVCLPPTSGAIIITSNNPLLAISKTFTPLMWLQ